MLYSVIAALSIFSACAITAETGGSSPRKAATRTIYEFPNDTYVENLTVRPNGQILVNVLTSPQVWLIDPEVPGRAVLVHEFTSVLGLSGIVEYKPDVYAIAGGNVSLETGESVVGSWSIWSLDLHGLDITSNQSVSAYPPVSRKIADVRPAVFLNGMALLSGPEKQLLVVGDIRTGAIYSVDIDTGGYAVVINDTLTAPALDYAFGLAGTDGIKTRNDTMYFSNIGQKKLNRARLNMSDSRPVGDVETVAHAPTARDQWDDFTLDDQGNAWMTTGGANATQRVNTRTGEVVVVAGDVHSTAIAEPTAAKFGRRESDLTTLYVTTAGGLATPVDGDIVIGGQLVAVDTA